MADWSVQIPVSELLELQNIVSGFKQLQAENKQLRARIDALHGTVYQLMEQILIIKNGKESH